MVRSRCRLIVERFQGLADLHDESASLNYLGIRLSEGLRVVIDVGLGFESILLFNSTAGDNATVVFLQGANSLFFLLGGSLHFKVCDTLGSGGSVTEFKVFICLLVCRATSSHFLINYRSFKFWL